MRIINHTTGDTGPRPRRRVNDFHLNPESRTVGTYTTEDARPRHVKRKILTIRDTGSRHLHQKVETKRVVTHDQKPQIN